jgi:hypothetical protein
MAKVPLADGELRITDAGVLPGVRLVRHLTRLTGEFSGTLTADEQELLATAPALRALQLADNPGLRSLSFLHGHDSLTWLRVVNAPGLNDISSLPSMPALQSVAFESCPEAADMESLLNCGQLHSLTGENFTLREARTLLAELEKLRDFGIRRCRAMHSLSDLGTHDKLLGLRLDACGQLSSLSGLSDLPVLTDLTFMDCPELSISGPYLANSGLRSLTLRWCGEVSNLEALSGMHELRRLYLQGLDIDDLSPLAGLDKLRSLAVVDCESVEDLSPLAGLPSLQHLSLQRTGHRLDLGRLGPKEDLTVEHSGNAYNGSRLGVSSTVTVSSTERIPD